MSPELFKYKPYSYKSDIWALGCVLYEICNLKHAFSAQTLNGLAVKILKGNYLPLSSQYSNTLKETIKSMLNTSPKARPTITDLLKKPSIKKKLVAYIINLERSEDPDEDLYLETIREQCEQLGIAHLIEKYKNSKKKINFRQNCKYSIRRKHKFKRP